MEYLGVLAFVIVLCYMSYPDKVKKLERKVKKLEKEMQYRLDCAREQGIPITNYGIAIAYMRGILERSMELF